MHFSRTFAAFLLPTLAVAQIYGPPPDQGSSGGSTTSSAQSASITAPPDTTGNVGINVAFNEQFVFSPANVSAPNGTIVTFFFPNAGLAHSVTQSSFADPCTPLVANSSTGEPAGFDSDFQMNVQWSINITNDQLPIWFHCKMPQHCGLGMVGSINAPTSGANTFDNFKAAALAIGANEPVESTNPPVLVGAGASASASPTNTAGSGSTSSNASSGAMRAAVPIVSFFVGIVGGAFVIFA